MFICNECERTFYECKVIKEYHPYGMSYATEYFSVCPYCESGDIAEAVRCKHCGEHFAELEADDLCDVCYGDLYGE